MIINWVCVVYGQPEQAVTLYESLLPTNQRHRFIVCCNKEGDAVQLSRWARTKSAVTIMDFPDNPGYLPAVHRAREQLGLSGCVVVSNADLIAKTPALQQIADLALEIRESVLVFAPSIVGSDGADQNPHLLQPPNRRKLQVLRMLHRYQRAADVLPQLRRRGQSARRHEAPSGACIWSGHGSCFVLLPHFFTLGGRTDYPMQLFGEELWIGREASRLHGHVQYRAEVVLLHAEHASTGVHRRGHVARQKYAALVYWSGQPLD